MLAVFTAMAAAAAASSHARQSMTLNQGLMPMTHRSHSCMAFVIPDVAWYDSQAIGWAGTNPDQQGDSSLGHGLIEQVFVDGLDNFLSCYGLALSLRATIPFLNGFILPSAPPVVEEKVLPFLAYISDPFVAVFRKRFDYSIGPLDLAVFPAFFGVLFLMGVTEAVGAPLPRHLQPLHTRERTEAMSEQQLQEMEEGLKPERETYRGPQRLLRLGDCWASFRGGLDEGRRDLAAAHSALSSAWTSLSHLTPKHHDDPSHDAAMAGHGRACASAGQVPPAC